MNVSNLSATKFPNLSNSDYVERVDAFMLSEQMYVNDFLRVLVDVQKLLTSYNQLNRDDPIVSDDELLEIFSSIQSIYQFSKGLLEKLTAQRWLGIDAFIENLAGILDQNIPFFKMYGNYILNVKKSIKKLKDLSNDKKRPVKTFMMVAEMTIGKGINTLIEAPVNRWPLYLRYVNSITDSLDDEHPSYDALQQCIKKILEVTDKIARDAENSTRRGRVVDLQNTELRKLALIDPTRKCYRSSDLKQKEGGKYKTYSFHQFSDFILGYSSDFFGGGVKAFIPLAGAKINVLPGTSLSLNISCPLISKEFDLSFANDKEYYKWLVDIKEVYEAVHLGQAKIMHPNDLEKTIKQENVNVNMINRPEPVSLESVIATINSIKATRRGQGEDEVGSPAIVAAKTETKTQDSSTSTAPTAAATTPSPALQRIPSMPPPAPSGNRAAPPVIPSKPIKSPPVPIRPGRPAPTMPEQQQHHHHQQQQQQQQPENEDQTSPDASVADAADDAAAAETIPAPPGMAPPSSHGTNETSPRMDLLASIRGGAALKKVEAESTPPDVTMDARTSHLSMIREGMALKKVDVSTPKAAEHSNPMLAAIIGGTKLRKVEIEEKTVSPVSDNPLFAQIQSGVQLRKVDQTPKKKVSTSPAMGMSEDVQKSLANYRKFVQEESDDDSEEW